ncbi:transposase [Nostoc sp.]
MSKPRKKQGNPDFRHQVTCPAPTSQEIESRLVELLTPGTFANLKGVKDKERSLRSRILTLPVMAAIVLSLVYRQIQYLTDVLRCLEVEGLLWVEAMSVSRQALSQRLESLPAQLFIKLFEQVVERLAAKKNPTEISPMWASVASSFGAVWIADASTLEAVKKHCIFSSAHSYKTHNYNLSLGWLSIKALWAWSKPCVGDTDATLQPHLTFGHLP